MMSTTQVGQVWYAVLPGTGGVTANEILEVMATVLVDLRNRLLSSTGFDVPHRQRYVIRNVAFLEKLED
jgi:hypothetical protein